MAARARAAIPRVDRNDHLEWKVEYEPGELIAIGKSNGKEIVRKMNATTGQPGAIELVSSAPVIHANGTDVSMIRVSIVDEHGRVVPTADHEVEFVVAQEDYSLFNIRLYYTLTLTKVVTQNEKN